MGDGRFVAYCVTKIQNKLKYNFSGRVSLPQVATVTGISTNWFENFQRFELWRVIFPGIFPTGVENWFELSGGSRNRGFEKSGFYCMCTELIRLRQEEGSSPITITLLQSKAALALSCINS